MGWSDSIEDRLSSLQEATAAALRLGLLPLIKGKRVARGVPGWPRYCEGVVTGIDDDMEVRIRTDDGGMDYIPLTDLNLLAEPD